MAPVAQVDRLTPPRVRRGWYILCRTDELRNKPITRRLWGQRLVLWRAADGRPSVLLDRCPHRNVPLSQGQVQGETLQCPYHGWRFDVGGHCKAIPGWNGEIPERATFGALSYAVREQQGFVWVWGEPREEPVGAPFEFRLAENPNYLVVRREVHANGTIHAVAENALDVPLACTSLRTTR